MSERCKHMKRVLVCGIVGVVATLLVAWAAALFAVPLRVGMPSVSPWPIAVPANWPVSPEAVSVPEGPGLRETSLYWVDKTGAFPMMRSVERKEAGWPLLAVRSPWVLDAATVHPIQLLPLRPLWPQFAFNTVFFGALAYMALYWPRGMRARRRLRRGACASCGYDLHGIAGPCPECGEGKEGSSVRT